MLDQFESHGLLAHVASVGAHMAAGLRTLVARHTAAQGVRGKGLMWGLVLDRDATPVVQAALRRGLLVNRTAERVVRMLPPYVISEREVDAGLLLLDEALAEATGGQG